MKYLICSDIHGSFTAAQKIVSIFTEGDFQKLVILGDILYHGPRNPLPEGYNPKAVVELLNSLKDKILACRGNCDAEVDQKVLSFPIREDFVTFSVNCSSEASDSATQKYNSSEASDSAASTSETSSKKITFLCSHGHVYAPRNPDNFFPKNCEDARDFTEFTPQVFLYGHTHVQVLKKRDSGIIVCNPGSTTLPKEKSPAGFAVLENGELSLLDMNRTVLKSISLI